MKIQKKKIIRYIKLKMIEYTKIRKHEYIIIKLRVISENVNIIKNQEIAILLKINIKKMILQFENFIINASLKSLNNFLKNISSIEYES